MNRSILFACAACALISVDIHAAPLTAFILAGQSNVEGQALKY